MPNLTDLFKNLTGQLANWVEIVAAVIIGIAVVEAAIRAFPLFVRRDTLPGAKEDVRLRLGRWLAVALEFELGADILRTAIAPSMNDIEMLAAIAAIRTALNYFLQKEIDRAAQREPGAADPMQSQPVTSARPEQRTLQQREGSFGREPAPA